MVEYKQDYINVKGVKIHYHRGGSGEKTLVLLHGATDNAMCWKPVADVLSRDYALILPDAQGHGLSDRLTPDFAFADHAAQVVALITELGIEKPILMGHSMGGTTATNVAGLYPDVPGAIILEDPGWMEATTPGDSPKPPDVATRLEMPKKSIEELKEMCRNEHPTWPEAELGPWAQSKKEFDTNLFTYLRINDPVYTDMVTKITCPALVITSDMGMVSDETVSKVMELWTADMPLQHVKVIGAGHNIRREQFDAYYAAVTGFINGL